jgi:hypothetical protein
MGKAISEEVPQGGNSLPDNGRGGTSGTLTSK